VVEEGYLSGVVFTQEQRHALTHLIRNKLLPARARLKKDMTFLDDYVQVRKTTLYEIDKALSVLEELCVELNDVGHKAASLRIKCKKGVWFRFVSSEFVELARIFHDVYQAEGLVPTVTSAADGVHGKNSLHPEGWAWDWRIWGLKDTQAVADEIRRRARDLSFRYDIVFGDPRHRNHIHSEFDIRKTA